MSGKPGVLLSMGSQIIGYNQQLNNNIRISAMKCHMSQTKRREEIFLYTYSNSNKANVPKYYQLQNIGGRHPAVFLSYSCTFSIGVNTVVRVYLLNHARLFATLGCSPPGSSVHGISQARILEWVAISSSRGTSQPRDQTASLASPALTGRFFTISAIWET